MLDSDLIENSRKFECFRTVSKTRTQPIDNVKSDDIEDELDETVPLPTMPAWSIIPTGAANDESYASQVSNENIERLVVLAESIENLLKVIAEAVVIQKSESPRGRKKKKRVARKRATAKRTTK